MGTDDEPWAYDNERPAHEVELGAFSIESEPVTNNEYAELPRRHGPRAADGVGARRPDVDVHPLRKARHRDGVGARPARLL